MNKMGLLKVVNPALFVSAVLQIFTSLCLFFRLLENYDRVLVKVHVYNGLVFITLVAIHIYLNWGWFKAQLFK